MKTKLILLLCASMISINTLVAQELTKSEKKALLQEIKQLKKEPLLYKKLKEDAEGKDFIINEQFSNNTYLKQENNNLKIENQGLKFTIASQENTLENTDDCSFLTDGTKYRIQLGLFKDFNMSSSLADPKYIVSEEVNGLYRYSIGNFDNKIQAQNFADEIKKMGISDAFVTEYNNGNRNMTFDALNNSSSKNTNLNIKSSTTTNSIITHKNEAPVVSPVFDLQKKEEKRESEIKEAIESESNLNNTIISSPVVPINQISDTYVEMGDQPLR